MSDPNPPRCPDCGTPFVTVCKTYIAGIADTCSYHCETCRGEVEEDVRTRVVRAGEKWRGRETEAVDG